MNIGRKGFTLIEILIVVAIIAILASVVLVGLGPTQQAGRDARRLSDLREVQNGLELFYQDCGFYPGGSATGASGSCGSYTPLTSGQWSSLQATIASVVPNAGQLPVDPTSNRSYSYWYLTGSGSSYVVGATLENANNSVLTTYQNPAPSLGSYTQITGPATGPTDCAGKSGGPDTNYCIGS